MIQINNKTKLTLIVNLFLIINVIYVDTSESIKSAGLVGGYYYIPIFILIIIDFIIAAHTILKAFKFGKQFSRQQTIIYSSVLGIVLFLLLIFVNDVVERYIGLGTIKRVDQSVENSVMDYCNDGDENKLLIKVREIKPINKPLLQNKDQGRLNLYYSYSANNQWLERNINIDEFCK